MSSIFLYLSINLIFSFEKLGKTGAVAWEFLFSFSNFSYQLCVNFTSKCGNIQLFTWWMILFSFDFSQVIFIWAGNIFQIPQSSKIMLPVYCREIFIYCKMINLLILKIKTRYLIYWYAF